MDPVIATVPDIHLNPASAGFGTVFIGASANLGVTRQNLGNADLNVSLIDRCAGTSPEFPWSLTAAFVVPAGAALARPAFLTPARSYPKVSRFVGPEGTCWGVAKW